MSQLHDRPTAAALVTAVRHFLETAMDPAAGAPTFSVRVAANALRIVERELELGPAQERRHARLLATLGVADEAELARAIRSGRLDGRLAEVADVVVATIGLRLAVDHPGYGVPAGAP